MTSRWRGQDRVIRLGLVGHPVGHSLSPALHRAAFEACSLRGDYELFDAPPEGLPEVVGRLRAGGLDGLNVTIPHKAAAAALCDRLEAAAATLGVANTLYVAADGALVGLNTDVAGLERAIVEAWPASRADGRAVAVIGAGGAAHAAVLAAAGFGPSEIRVWNRTPGRAEALVTRLQPVVTSRLVVAATAEHAARDAVFLLQATSMGMATVPESAAWRELQRSAQAIVGAMSPDGRVYDLVYRPARTPWVAAAEAAGRTAVEGLGMLVHQAALAFEIWTGVRPPTSAMRRAAETHAFG